MTLDEIAAAERPSPDPAAVDMRSAAVTTRGEPGESYKDFTKRVKQDQARVNAKCASLDEFTPSCPSCGETCNPEEAGRQCKWNGMLMASRWAREVAEEEFYNLGYFARGGWSTSVHALACLLDRVRAGALDGKR
jgi:hypothetical protein